MKASTARLFRGPRPAPRHTPGRLDAEPVPLFVQRQPRGRALEPFGIARYRMHVHEVATTVLLLDRDDRLLGALTLLERGRTLRICWRQVFYRIECREDSYDIAVDGCSDAPSTDRIAEVLRLAGALLREMGS